jgi:hypothetical protein
MDLKDYISELACVDDDIVYQRLEENSQQYVLYESQLYDDEINRPPRDTLYHRYESNTSAAVISPIDLTNPFFFSLRDSYHS